MLTGAAVASEGDAPPRRRRLQLASWIAKATVSFALALVAIGGAIGLLLDTDLGHRLILDRIAAIAPDSGLRIRIGRIEGSIWSRTELRDVRLYDPDGLFAEAPEIELEWQPVAWLWNRLLIHEAASELVIVHRRPKLLDGPEPTLPRYDIHVGRLEIAQLRFEPGIAGPRRVARVAGEAEYRRGRFLLDLEARMLDGGDRLALLVDAAPERDEFDLDFEMEAPADGMLAGMLGTRRPLRIEARGDGDWRRWTGTARLAIDGADSGELRLSAVSGTYRAEGWIAPAPLLTGSLAELSAPRARVGAAGRFDGGVLDGRLAARSEAMRIAIAGGADLVRDRYRDVRIMFELLRPVQSLGGASRGTSVTASLDGPFDDAAISYRVSAPRLQLGGISFDGVQASGGGRLTPGALTVSIAAGVRNVGGVGDEIAALLAGLSVAGTVRAADGRVETQALRFASRGSRGQINFSADLDDGRYALGGVIAAPAYPMQGIGLVDLRAAFAASSTAPLAGTAQGVVRRIDNGALAWATGGPLRIATGIAGGHAGGLRFPNMRLSAPQLQLSGTGSSDSDGSMRFEGSGRQSSLGPFALRLAGSAQRPLLAMRLARPSRSLGISNVSLEIEPARAGFAYRGTGTSPLGRFASRGTFAPSRGGSASLNIASLAVSGATASGALRAGPEGVAGSLDFRGALAGPLVFATGNGGGQRVEAHLVATDARLGALPIGSGRLDASLETGEGLRGRVSFSGAADRLWQATGVDAASLSGPLTIEAEIAGTLAEPAVRGSLRLAGGRLTSSAITIERLEARGSFDRRRLVLDSVAGRSRNGGRVEGSGSIAFDGPVAGRLEAERIEFIARGLDSRWNAALRIGGTAAAPALSGEATLVSGTYQVLGRPIELTRGTMNFDGAVPPDPLLDLVARPAIGPAIRITGRASRPQIGIANPFSRREEPAPPASLARETGVPARRPGRAQLE